MYKTITISATEEREFNTPVNECGSLKIRYLTIKV